MADIQGFLACTGSERLYPRAEAATAYENQAAGAAMGAPGAGHPPADELDDAPIAEQREGAFPFGGDSEPRFPSGDMRPCAVR